MGGGGTDVDDGTAPSNIADLRITSVTDSSITLAWTATGDDSTVGTASQYDMRVCNQFITNAEWEEAFQLSGEPTPRPAGQTDSMIVNGLMADSTYFFALQACDESENCSWRSNCAQGSCVNDYVVTFPDSNLEAAVRLMIHQPEGDIRRSSLMGMTFLEGNSAGIGDLTGLQHCTNLRTIYMGNNPISDLTPISQLPRLIDIQFAGNNISNISPVANLSTLLVLYLRNNPLANISAISGLTNLQKLDLTQSGLTDIDPLVANAGLAVGDTVYLEYNPLSQYALDIQIPALEARGVTVIH
jgi:hypothetical protein